MHKKYSLIGLLVIACFLILTACGTPSPTPAAGMLEIIPITGLQDPVFNDVPYDYSETMGGVVFYLHDPIQALFEAGLTVGTSTNPPLFSPADLIDRIHFAVFLLRAEFGRDYVPPAAPWSIFSADDWTTLPEYQKWAEGMYRAHLTSGCQADPLMFCPTQPLTRLDAVTFALRLKFNTYDNSGSLIQAYEPPAASGTLFADMTEPSFYGTRWAEASYAYNLLPECGTAGGKPLFCPNDPLDRAWAAYIIVGAVDLALP